MRHPAYLEDSVIEECIDCQPPTAQDLVFQSAHGIERSRRFLKRQVVESEQLMWKIQLVELKTALEPRTQRWSTVTFALWEAVGSVEPQL